MKIFVVNRKYYIDNLENAILKAKEIIAERATSPINNCWVITQGKKKGYCVKLLDDWSKVGNSNLLKVIIQVVEIENIFNKSIDN